MTKRLSDDFTEDEWRSLFVSNCSVHLALVEVGEVWMDEIEDAEMFVEQMFLGQYPVMRFRRRED